MSGYEYTAEDRVAAPHRYRFSPWGDELLDAWRADRAESLAQLGEPAMGIVDAVSLLDCRCQSAELLSGLAFPLLDGPSPRALARLPRWIHKWEVAKRLVTRYDRDLRRASENDREPAPYLLLAIACLAGVRHGAGLPALNAALKICDTVCSIQASLKLPEERTALIWIIRTEGEHVARLLAGEALSGAGATSEGEPPAPDRREDPAAAPLPDLAMLLLHNRRSQAYLQALLTADLIPGRFVLLDPGGARSYAARGPASDRFDASEEVTATLERHGLPWTTVPTADANDPAVLEAVAALDSGVVVYCGGGILREPLLSLGKRFIHVHPGTLPRYRGSTCFYYQLIEEGRCAATAFVMDTGLDTGAVLAHQTFVPPAGEDLDEIFDPWMRSQVLVDAVGALGRDGELRPSPQPAGEERTFYVIHPVLKTVALRTAR